MLTQTWKRRETTTYRFFAETGFLLYNKARNIVLDGQVLEFCDPYTQKFQSDFCFLRSHVLMSSTDGIGLTDAEMVMDPAVKIKVKPSPASYVLYLNPDSIMGFMGSKMRRQTWVELAVLMKLNQGANWSSFQVEPDQALLGIFPRFYVLVSWKSLPPVLRPRAVQMCNLDRAGEVQWFLPLAGTFSPFTVGWPLALTEEKIQAMEFRFRMALASVGKVYIGSSALAPALGWRQPGLALVDTAHPFYQFARQTCGVMEDAGTSQLNMVFESSALATNPVRNFSYHVPYPETKDRQHHDAYLASTLNGPAMDYVLRLDDQTSPLPKNLQQLMGVTA